MRFSRKSRSGPSGLRWKPLNISTGFPCGIITRKTSALAGYRTRRQGRRVPVALSGFSTGPLVLELIFIGAAISGSCRTGDMSDHPCHDRDLCLVHLHGNRMAREAAAEDERTGYGRQSEGHRQPAEFRDCQIFRRRETGGAPMTRRWRAMRLPLSRQAIRWPS